MDDQWINSLLWLVLVAVVAIVAGLAMLDLFYW